jgi:hypothetical protein
MFGKPCAELEENDPVLALGAPPSLERALDREDAPFYVEIGRYLPFTAEGALLSCWGDPRTEPLAVTTGGDCDDLAPGTHRELPEGPDDLVNVFAGDVGDCRRCTDGVDNNCDGLSDCEDPTCAVCFVGQGRGCAGLRDACADDDAGCTTLPSGVPSPLFPALALALATRRRRAGRGAP